MSTNEEVMAAMHGDDRGPLDYDPMADERRMLINIIRMKTESAGGGNYTEGGGGERSLLKWLLGLSSALIVVSVVGGIGLYGKVSAIEANQAAQAAQAARMQNQIDRLAESVQTLTRRQ